MCQWRSKHMYCMDFIENALFASFGIINFADAKLLDLYLYICRYQMVIMCIH